MAAAYCAGLITAPQALLAAYFRGVAVVSVSQRGAMLAAGVGQDVAEQIINNAGANAVVACVNSPENVTISGDSAGIDAVERILEKRKLFYRRLQTNNTAYHSPHMKTVGENYQVMLEQVMKKSDLPEKRNARIPMISTVTGKEINEYLGPSYWRRNLESPVLFQKAIEELDRSSVYHIIELGPHSTLQLPIKQIRNLSKDRDTTSQYSSALSRSKNQPKSLLTLVGDLYSRGHLPNFSAINSSDFSYRILEDSNTPPQSLSDLPPYKWNYETRAWVEPRASIEFRQRKYQRHELLGSQIPGGDGIEHRWRNILKTDDVPWLSDHKVSV